MSANPQHTPYHPRWYRASMPIFWWMRRWIHARFILRELTSIFVAGYALVYLLQLRALGLGPEAYASFLDLLRSPLSISLHGVSLVFVIYHSITWFNLAPRALALRIGDRRVPDKVIAGLNFVAWIGISAALAWVTLKG